MRLQVVWRGVDGSVWPLLGPTARNHPDGGGCVLLRPTGFVAKPEIVKRANSTGVGKKITKISYPDIEGVLDLQVWGGKGQKWSSLVRSFSLDKPGTLEVSDTRGMTWFLPCTLKEELESTEWSPTGRRTVARVQPALVSDQGLWGSPVRRVPPHPTAQQTVAVTNHGDVDLCPWVIWSGAPTKVTLPGGMVVQLPAVSGEHRVSTDPGTGYTVLGPDGKQAKNVWAKFRGLAIPGNTKPGETSVWSLGARVGLEYQDMVRSPWR